MKRVAIIGSGLSGTSATVHLVRELLWQRARNVHIVIYEPSDKLGTGTAYALDLPNCFLLNHELNHMGSVSLFPLPKDDQQDFHQWILHHRAELEPDYPGFNFTSPDAFAPRSMYGRYLKARLQEAMDAGEKNGMTVEVRRAEVTDIQRAPRSLKITSQDANGPKHELFSYGILAMGHWYKQPLLADQAPDRALSAYPAENYLDRDIPPERSKLIVLGTGLTAIDTAIVGLESGKFSHVTMVSRRGQLRGLRGRTEPYTPQFLTMANLEARAQAEGRKHFKLHDAIELLHQELDHAYEAPIDWESILAPQDTHGFLKGQLAQVDAGEELRWRSVIDSLDAIRQQVYQRLLPEDQVEFVENWQNLYLSYRASMPPENGRKLLDFMERGLLDIRNCADIRYDQGTEQFTTTDKNGQATHADLLIDARGQSYDYKAQPLLRHLVDHRRLLTAHPAGGIRIDTKTGQVETPEGQKIPLYALGPVAHGHYLNPPHTIMISSDSQQIAAQIGSALGHSRG